MAAPLRAAVLTISDSVAAGQREDESGPAVRALLEESGWTVPVAEVLSDDFPVIRDRLAALVAGGQVAAVFTAGGTGLGSRDRTPEATSSVMERSLPGLAEAMRRAGTAQTPYAVLSRSLAGVSGKTLLINLPGSPQGARESLQAILGVLPHAVEVLHGEEVHRQGSDSPPAANSRGPSSDESPGGETGG